MEKNLYKLKHIPTGLYYQLLRGKYELATNLSKKGKIYQNNSNALNGTCDYIFICISVKQFNSIGNVLDKSDIVSTPRSTYRSNYCIKVLKSDFEKDYLL